MTPTTPLGERKSGVKGNPLTRVPAATAAEVCQTYAARPQARALLTSELIPLRFLDRLVAAESTYPDGIDFLAHALPRREAVWWGCLSLWNAAGPKLSPDDQAAVAAAVGWVLEPGEPQRQAAQAPADATPGSPAGMLATAVVRSGGSMLPPNLPLVEPPPSLTGDTVAAGLHVAAAQAGPEEIVARYRQFVALGIGVAQGKYSWIVAKEGVTEGQPFWPGQSW
jgi:hypothetical protein